MKYVIVLSCFLAVAYGVSNEALDKVKAEVMKQGLECKGEMSVTDEDLTPILKNQPPTTDKGKCFLACVAKKLGVLDASGKISKSGIDAQLDKIKSADEDLYNKLRAVGDKCMDQDADNECETAFNLFNCGTKGEKEVGIPDIDWSS